MRASLIFACVTIACLPLAFACDGKPNLNPIITNDPVLVKEVPNGKLFTVGAPILSPEISVVHLYGSPYQMGYAHGQLLGPTISTVFDQMYQYIYSEVDQYIQFLPQWLRQIIETDGVYLALEATYWLTSPYIPDHFTQEIQGMADAMNVTADSIMRIVLFPELIQASCSMMGAWGSAIADVGGSLYQLRALDWGTDSPLQQFPEFLVYHPTVGANFSVLTWSGFVGAITGISSTEVAVCEKVWDAYTGVQSRSGYPWHFLLRDVLQFDMNRDQAFERMQNANRTCAIWVGVGDSSSNQMDVIQYSYQQLNRYNNTNDLPDHSHFDDLMYVDKHVQPSSDPCLPELIKQYYGSLNATNIFQYITSQFQTGNMHLAVFDYNDMFAYVANASPNVNNTAVPAYDRPFVRIDLRKAFTLSQ